MAARKQDDYEMWLAALEKVRNETDKKKADVIAKVASQRCRKGQGRG
jgi:hypothetical protein